MITFFVAILACQLVRGDIPTVDQDGNVLDILVQSRRNKHAAKRFFRKLLKG